MHKETWEHELLKHIFIEKCEHMKFCINEVLLSGILCLVFPILEEKNLLQFYMFVIFL